MARSEARVSVDVWDDDDFLQLSAGAQRLYLFLISQRDLSHLGVVALRERRWSRSARDLTQQSVTGALTELADRRYVVVDFDAEELLVRSLIRRDKVYKQPNVFRAAADYLRLVTSPIVRAELARELRRIEGEEMNSTSADILTEMLGALSADPPLPPGRGSEAPARSEPGDDTRPSMSPEGDDTGLSIPPVREGSRQGSPQASRGTPGVRGALRPYVAGSPSPDPLAPRDPSGVSARATRGDARGTRLPADFTVSDEMKTWARENAPLAGIRDHEMFVDHWRAQTGQRAVKRDWEATWRNWMRRCQDNREHRGGRPPAAGQAPATRPSTTDDRVAQGLDLGRRLQAVADAEQQRAVGA